MKILHVLPSLARGGGERLMIELANLEAAAGHEVAVVAGWRVEEKLAWDGLASEIDLRFVAARPVSGYARYLPLIPWLWRERRWLSGQDVVHCHMSYGAVFGTVLKLMPRFRGARRPAIVETYHAVGMPIPGPVRWLHARMAAGREAVSFMVEESYWRHFMARHPKVVSRVIPVGVTEPRSAPSTPAAKAEARAEFGIPANCRLVVGTIGRLLAERQPLRYIPVFARIAQALGPQVHFLVGGDGPERAAMEAAAAEHGLEGRVHLPGLIRELDRAFSVMDLYVTANVGAVPGVAGLQAVAAGLPVIGLQLLDYYTAGPEDWIESSRGAEDLAARAVELLRSEEAHRALVSSQQAHLKAHHSPRAMAQAYERLYREAIARCG